MYALFFQPEDNEMRLSVKPRSLAKLNNSTFTVMIGDVTVFSGLDALQAIEAMIQGSYIFSVSPCNESLINYIEHYILRWDRSDKLSTKMRKTAAKLAPKGN